MSNVQARIEQVICVKYNLPGDIPHTARFLEDLGIDKGGEGYVDWQEFLMALEEEFGVEIPDEAAEQIITLWDMVLYIEPRQTN